MTTSGVIGLNAITTNAELDAYLNDPTVAETFPTEEDGRYHLARVYSGQKMNGSRTLDQLYVIRAVSRNCGTFSDSELFGLPSPKELYDRVLKLLPDFVKSKINKWAESNKDGAIADIIITYVKKALGFLGIPAIFLNAVTNLVIPPLNLPGTIDTEFIFSCHTAECLALMLHFDRMILLAGGLTRGQLPETVSLAASKNSLAAAVPGDEIYAVGQPDDQEGRTDLKQFYQDDTLNGFKPLQLLHVIEAQIRTNPKSDEPITTFGEVVWNTLDDACQTQLEKYAKESPPNKKAIADELYTPLQTILQGSPYHVPPPILNSFTTMKAPEVTEWVVDNHGNPSSVE
ncbi:hypothetical protein GALMADRAFT_1366210 [Galerina marginata CBS 339.88]|uniref:Uncharacterized protein n=1 Tax=Galerina marginata (strain CBS 339.88) TaxID=685588 RepID=A0A067SC89_GALM3|nr:hypothetical protein GALMADRAFT_1366210 [Galerina marginata CBS 339.88]